LSQVNARDHDARRPHEHKAADRHPTRPEQSKDEPSPHSILGLQRSAGNHAVTELLASARPKSRGPATAPPLVIQRFDSFEHIALGDKAKGGPQRILLDAHRKDLPDYANPPAWPAQWKALYAAAKSEEQKLAMTEGLTYGEVVALMGDFYESWKDLNEAPLREIWDLIPLIHSTEATTSELQDATAGRYLALAKKNVTHFSNVGAGLSNIETWRTMHAQAVDTAKSAGTDAEVANTAWGMNAASDHFLTDAFSSGHMRQKRDELIKKGGLAQLESKVLHELDNQNGVRVKNKFEEFIAYGDDMLLPQKDGTDAGATTRKWAEAAVAASKQDLADALSQGKGYNLPNGRSSAEDYVPHVVNMAEDRWTGRTPVYVQTPDGPMRVDDYKRMQDKVIAAEGPGYVSGLIHDVDQARAWVKAQQGLSSLQRLSVDERTRLINLFLSAWWIRDSDVAAIEQLCEGVSSSDLSNVRKQVDASVMHSSAQRQRVLTALYGMTEEVRRAQTEARNSAARKAYKEAIERRMGIVDGRFSSDRSGVPTREELERELVEANRTVSRGDYTGPDISLDELLKSPAAAGVGR
jgi:hypothetical protein